MMLFQPPATTRYDLRFTLAGIPVRVHPLFWVLTILLGGFGGNLLHLLIWIAVVFVSILIHELGHALALRMYGQPSQVILYLGGGLTVPEPVWWGSNRANISLRAGQEILVSFAGPGTCFLFAGLVLAVARAAGGTVIITPLLGVIPLPTVFLPVGGYIANLIVMNLLWVNVFWGFINLMPVYPLDGGNIARQLFLKFDPLDGIYKSLWISVVTGGIVAVASLFLLRSTFIALLFGFLAFQSYQSLKGSAMGGYR